MKRIIAILRHNDNEQMSLASRIAKVVGVCALIIFVVSLVIGWNTYQACAKVIKDYVMPSSPEVLIKDMNSLVNTITDIREKNKIKSETCIEIEYLPGEIMLTGIAWNEDAPLAFINGKVLNRGDEVDGFIVTDIQKERIVVTDTQGREKMVYLYDQEAYQE